MGYTLNVSNIHSSAFNFPGCESFAEYISKYTGYARDIIDLSIISEFNGVNKSENTGKKLSSRYLDKFTINSLETLELLLASEYQNDCKGTVKLPYIVNNIPLEILLSGTAPQFHSLICQSTFSGARNYFKISRTPSQISIYHKSDKADAYALVDYTMYDTRHNKYAPLCVAFYLQAPGGPGEGGIATGSGKGGGSGCFACGILNFAAQPDYYITSLRIYLASSTTTAVVKTFLQCEEAGGTSILEVTGGRRGEYNSAGGTFEKTPTNSIHYSTVYKSDPYSTDVYYGVAGRNGGESKGSSGASFEKTESYLFPNSSAPTFFDTELIPFNPSPDRIHFEQNGGTSGGKSGYDGIMRDGGGGAASLFASGGDGATDGNGFPGDLGSGGGGGHAVFTGLTAGGDGGYGFIRLYY